MSNKYKIAYRDICGILQMFREFLMGRPHNRPSFHQRFAPFLAPRTIPTPDIPREPPRKSYADKYYYTRNVKNSVMPAVVAPVATGPKPFAGPLSPGVGEPYQAGAMTFSCPPTPGPTWWWDGHSYYEEARDPSLPPLTKSPDPSIPPP